MSDDRTHRVDTFRRPDRPGTYLWSCTCGEYGLLNRNGNPFSTRLSAESGGRVHEQTHTPTPTPTPPAKRRRTPHNLPNSLGRVVTFSG